MTSLLTNTIASATLRQMSVTQRDLQQAQNQASSGLRVASASDNAAYWSIGVAMRSQVGAVSAVKDGLALTMSIGAVTTNALQAIIAEMSGIKNDLVAAQQSGVDSSDINLDLKARQQQIISIANAASFNGENWLVAQDKTDETIADTTSYDQSQSTVQSILSATTNASSSFNETVASVITYSRTLTDGTTQTMSTDSRHTDTYSDTVTPLSTTPVTYRKVANAPVIGETSSSPNTGNLDPLSSQISIVQSYQPVTGLNIASISDDEFRLFTVNSGTVKETNVSSFAGQLVDNNLRDYGKSQIVLRNSQATSYNTNSSDVAAGVLDRSVNVSNASGGGKTSLLTMSAAGATDVDLGTMLQATDKALAKLTTAGANVGALMTRIDGQTAFNAALSDALTAGIGALTDADMNTTATRIQALATQQQLQTQALSIANQNTAMILKLFA